MKKKKHPASPKLQPNEAMPDKSGSEVPDDQCIPIGDMHSDPPQNICSDGVQSRAVTPIGTDPIEQIMEWQSRRVATISMQVKIINANRALLRRAMGFQIMLPEKERKAITKRSTKLYTAMQKGKPIDAADARIAIACKSHIDASSAYLEKLAGIRESIEDDMKAAAEKLPAAAWAKTVRGFGKTTLLQLAVLIGECGDLSNYSTPSKLWKRLGLAPRFCYAAVTKDGNACNKRPARRRSVSWVIADCLLKGNRGEYSKLYRDRRAYEAARTDDGHPKTKMHAHRLAQKYIEKRFILHLWRAWRDAVVVKPTAEAA